MNQLGMVKKAIGELSHQEIKSLLDFLRNKTDFIIPKCYSRTEILNLLESRGESQPLSESHYQQLKKEFDNSCSGIMTEILRTHLLLALDAESDISATRA